MRLVSTLSSADAQPPARFFSYRATLRCVTNARNWAIADIDALASIKLDSGMEEHPLHSWPDHMQAVFARIGTLMDGKRLSPALLDRLPDICLDIMEGHQVTVRHRSAEELGDKRGRYTVTIAGPRIDGQWHVLPGQMEKLSREASSAISNVG